MGEQYFVPAQFTITDDFSFSALWLGSNYRVFNGCVDRVNGSTLDFIEVSPWGFTVDSGSTFVPADTRLITGSACDSNFLNINEASISRSIFDSPNFAPYEPFYFLGFLVFSIFLLISAVKLIFGRGYK